MRSRKYMPRIATLTLCIMMIAVLGAVSATPAYAADDAAGHPPLWFNFNVGRVTDEFNQSVTVTLDDQANCRGQFKVFAGGDWSHWGSYEEDDWMGVATKIDDDTYQWVGDLVPGTYHVLLGGGAHLPCTLGVSGQATQNLGAKSFGQTPTPVVLPPSPAPAPAPASPAAATETTVIPKIKSEVTPGQWVQLTSNEPVIFKFRVGHVEDDDDGTSHSRISVELKGRPFCAGEFQVFDSSVTILDRPEEDDWIGCSCEEEGENPQWHGKLVPGEYRIRVEPQGAKEILLSISGEAVSY